MISQDPIALAQKLISFPSVTQVDAGIADFLIDYLTPHGFVCEKLVFGDIINIYARYGVGEPNLCFAGHTDVVPVGSQWSVDPFNSIIKDGLLYGRGASDMKGALAASIAASIKLINTSSFKGSISFLITGDEEGEAENGTIKVLQHLQNRQEKIAACIVGEPTCLEQLGDIIKYGRRGSINFDLTIKGKQGHVAYPEQADNPITTLIQVLKEIKETRLDKGNQDFQESNLEITDITVGNLATNVIPQQAHAKFNIRFNTEHTATSLYNLINDVCFKHSGNYELKYRVGAEAFVNTRESALVNCLKNSVFEVTGIIPNLSTTGGTSDARFIKDYTQVIEFGLVNKMAHHVDEYVVAQDITKLKEIYFTFLKKFFEVV